jgi:hypothetical protein
MHLPTLHNVSRAASAAHAGLQKISTGTRIPTAKHDAAGLARFSRLARLRFEHSGPRALSPAVLLVEDVADAPTVTLGPLVLYAKASSFEPKMAQLMAMDRIALSLSDARGISLKVRKCLEDHGIVVARKA